MILNHINSVMIIKCNNMKKIIPMNVISKYISQQNEMTVKFMHQQC